MKRIDFKTISKSIRNAYNSQLFWIRLGGVDIWLILIYIIIFPNNEESGTISVYVEGGNVSRSVDVDNTVDVNGSLDVDNAVNVRGFV